MRAPILLALALVPAGACIAPSVLDDADRSVSLEAKDVAWAPAAAEDVPGTYVSTVLEGPLAAALRKLVYAFGPDGEYTGAALIDGDPAHFEVLTGGWTFGDDGLRLDGGPAAQLEVAPDGSLRMSGDEGRVTLRREIER